MHTLLYLLFVQASLLIPGYVMIKKSHWLNKHPGLELSFAYLLTIVFFALLATFQYALKLNPTVLRAIAWLTLLVSIFLFIKNKYYKNVWELRFPILCLLAMSIFFTAFISLSFLATPKYIPDPTAQANRNYSTLNVKVLNVAQTAANDNYIPYRQAQFFTNRSDPAKDSFIDEWGVHFFQRTPLMGAITATYFNLLGDQPPIDYTWSGESKDTDNTYLKFQVIAHVLNGLFVVPAFFLLTKLFKRKTAVVASLFLVSSQYFLYNAMFTWPKSFVAFFILLSWLLLLENKMMCTVLAAIASGVAYLAHDLAILYIGASVVLLLANKRFREMFIFSVTSLLFAIPWLFISGILYRKPSSFIYYPISLRDIPQVNQKSEILHEFLNTHPLRIIQIRIHNFLYIMSPYSLFTSEGGQTIARRAWVLGQYSVPGAVGFGLIFATIIGIFKKLVTKDFWILVLMPVIFSTAVIGWPKGLAALHFAEAIVVLLVGLGAAFLVYLKKLAWAMAAYIVNCLQLIYYVIYSYNFTVGGWITSFGDILKILIMASIVAIAGYLLYATFSKRKTKISEFAGI